MDNTAHISFNASDRSYFSILKKEIHAIAATIGFNDIRAGEIDIIVAEMATNLVKHAGGGEILVRTIRDNDNDAIELISIDSGPGMTEPKRMLEDGISTSNTLGHGLGSIKRLSDTFEIYSLKDWGTILLSRVYKKKPRGVKKPRIEIRSVIVAKPGETVSGDGAFSLATPAYTKIFLGDGLGHGIDAHKAVQEAITAFGTCNDNDPIGQLRNMHTAVRKTRGLVGTAAIYSLAENKWHICGVGNIATRTQTGMITKNYMSYNGIIGLHMPNTLNEQQTDGQRGQMLIMCSDGIKTRWELQKYTGIFKCDLSVMAAAIYKDHGRKTDDMSVLISRVNATA